MVIIKLLGKCLIEMYRECEIVNEDTVSVRGDGLLIVECRIGQLSIFEIKSWDKAVQGLSVAIRSCTPFANASRRR